MIKTSVITEIWYFDFTNISTDILECGEIITPLLYLKEEEDKTKTMPTCMFKD